MLRVIQQQLGHLASTNLNRNIGLSVAQSQAYDDKVSQSSSSSFTIVDTAYKPMIRPKNNPTQFKNAASCVRKRNNYAVLGEDQMPTKLRERRMGEAKILPDLQVQQANPWRRRDTVPKSIDVLLSKQPSQHRNRGQSLNSLSCSLKAAIPDYNSSDGFTYHVVNRNHPSSQANLEPQEFVLESERSNDSGSQQQITVEMPSDERNSDLVTLVTVTDHNHGHHLEHQKYVTLMENSALSN